MTDTVTISRQTFIDAIVKDPDDFAMRKVFADWLEDNGEYDNAMFLRMQMMTNAELSANWNVMRTVTPSEDMKGFLFALTCRNLFGKKEMSV